MAESIITPQKETNIEGEPGKKARFPKLWIFIGVCAGVLIDGLFVLGAFLGQKAIIFSALFVIFVLAIVAFTAVGYARVAKKEAEKHEEHFKNAYEASKTKDEFISMVLHHLRTPLAGMRWMINEVMRGKRYAPDVKEIFETIYETDKRALAAVNHLLNVAHASMERIEYTLEDISVEDLQEMIKKNIDMFKDQFKEEGIALKKSFVRQPEGIVNVDKEKIATIVQTLIENALHYTPTGGSVTVSTHVEKKYYVIDISDTGIGIGPTDKDKIFIQFYRTDGAIKRNPEGFGVGLFLVKLFIERQGGNISFTSELEKGTTFTIKIPLSAH